MRAEMIRKLAAAGLDTDQIASVAELMDAEDEARKAKGRDRVRRHRQARNAEKCDVTLQNDTAVTGSFLSPSPTPPTTNLSPVTPYSPPLKTAKTAGTAPHDEQNPLVVAEQLWEIASKASKSRSGRPATRKATAAAFGKGATAKALRSSVVELCRTGGDHAKGLHRIIEGEHWREFLAKPQAPPGPTSEAEQRRRLQHLHDTGEWKPHWGDRPREAA